MDREHFKCYEQLHLGYMLMFHFRCDQNVISGYRLENVVSYISNVDKIFLAET